MGKRGDNYAVRMLLTTVTTAYLDKWLILSSLIPCSVGHLHLFPRILFLVFFLIACVSSAVEPLTSITRVRALSPEEAAQGRPVSIEGTITFCDPPRPSLLLHDGHEGIFVSLTDNPQERPQYSTGTRVRIDGVTQPGGFLPIIEGRHITVLGEGKLPEPLHIDSSELFSPALDCQWVQVPATITGLEKSDEFVLVAEIAGWTVKLIMPHEEHGMEQAKALMQRPVIVRGVLGSVFNGHRQLTARHFFVPSFNQIIPTENLQSEEEPQLRAINELLRSDATSRSRVRVRGIVTHDGSDGFYLRSDDGSMLVRTSGADEYAPGTVVEAEGFATVAPFRPIFRATQITTLNHTAPPAPQPLDLSREEIVRQQAEFVTVDADFLTRRDGPAGDVVLQCRTDKWFFEAVLADHATLPPDLAANDKVRLTGICELTTTHPLPFASAVDGFRLHLQKENGISILQRAPWWTLRRLFWALGFIAGLALMAIVWAALLRRRVTEQTKTIATQIERAVIKDERQRIARELHDTIEQELAGLSVQLRNARQRLLNMPEQAGTAIELAERMLRHCREEARTSIRDLRSVALEQRGLPGALEETLAPLVEGSGARLSFEARGRARSLAGPVEIHILRIAQQAVANAVQHAAPKEIRVHLEYLADAVTLEVRDDGRGFDPAAPAPRGHFGILGIRERANKIHATLTVDSAPGAGTTIRAVVPIAAVEMAWNGHPNGTVL
ncbi:integral membrane sensor signal transduction histidine kinase [Chthoniobacter flavus Ellin428]|uniref:Integral membrane sensor signal transduction histidine kinase n=1 Tax=Chthoniobacter flavus Ellin428 TaxID=497964 RepID=B4D830_9BACT|nr:integral membrane sensor signal transduction histidine kinase [Chthoniobacter flavus Ellin428]TCO87367.1 histidine kinase/DNA gyrase B/HSP90-like ATPase [Chthoniobacter flavus]